MATHSSILPGNFHGRRSLVARADHTVSPALYVSSHVFLSAYLCHCNLMYSNPCHFGYFLPCRPRFPAGYSRCIFQVWETSPFVFEIPPRSGRIWNSTQCDFRGSLWSSAGPSTPGLMFFFLFAESRPFAHLRHCLSPFMCTLDVFAFRPVVTVSGSASHVGVHVSVGRIVFSRCSPQKGIPGPRG